MKFYTLKSCSSAIRWLTIIIALLLFGFNFSTAAFAANPNANAAAGKIIAPPHKPNELLIKYRRGLALAQSASVARSLGALKIKSLVPSQNQAPRLAGTAIAQWQHVTLPPNQDLKKLRAQLMQNPMVEYVEYNYIYDINQIPNDPLFSQTWGLHNTGQAGGTADADIDGPETWDAGIGNFNTLVAVIDTGVDYNHPDLAANIWTNPGEIAGNGIDDDGNGYIDDIHGYDFVNNDGDPLDDNRHGTHVSGTIAAVGDNGIGVAGVNWQTRVMAVKVFSAGGSGSLANIIPGILYASANGAKVMNNSWGGGGFSQALFDAISVTNADGALFIAAAGNSGRNNDLSPHYPSSYTVPNIIAVAATDRNDARAWFSSYGATSVDLGAPGLDVYSTLPNNSYGSLSGTSMATPHVAGAATLLMALSPQFTHLQIKQAILNSVDPIPSMAGITLTGGRLNISQIVAPDLIPPDPVPDLAVAATGILSIDLTWSATGDDGSVGNAAGYDLRYSTAPIDATNFDQANSAGQIAATGPVGTPESHTVLGLSSNVTYYFAIKVLDDVGNASSISNLVSGTTQNSNIYFDDSMETGAAKWIINGSDGVGGPALWHISSHRSISPSNAMYYGLESSLRYNTGARNFGTLTTVPIDLTGVFGPELSFMHYLDIDPLDPAEEILIEVSTDGGASWKDVFDTNKGTNKQWQVMNIQLNDFEDQVIQIRFSFDSGDAIANNFEGWVIDDVRVYTLATPNQPPTPSPGGPYTGTVGVPIALNGLGSSDPDGDALTYAWDFGDGNFGVGANPSHTYATAGTYTVSLIVSDGTVNSLPVTTTATVVNSGGGNQPPTANPGGPYNGVVNVAISFDGSTSSDPDGDALTYTWDFGDGGTAVGANPSHIYTTAGTYTVTLVVNDGALNSTVASTTTTITTGGGNNQAPVADAGGPYQEIWSKAIEFNGDASFDPDGDLITFSWDFGDGTTGSGNAPQHTYSAPGVYTVTLTVSDGQATGTATVTATITNQAPTANPGGPYAGSVGGDIELNGDGSSDPDGDNLTYQWDFGDGSTGTGVEQKHVYNAAGSYTITLTVSDGQASDTATTTATIQ